MSAASSERGIGKHRANAHRHALGRLRERHAPDATHQDVIELRDRARELVESGRYATSHSDAVRVGLQWRGKYIEVIYAPRHDALRTVAP